MVSDPNTLGKKPILRLLSFDEPNLKATFAFNITVPESYIALSNMTESRIDQVGDGLLKFIFETSPYMSTYVSCQLFLYRQLSNIKHKVICVGLWGVRFRGSKFRAIV